MHFLSTITIPREHEEALLRDLHQHMRENGHTYETTDVAELLSDWYDWYCEFETDKIVSLQPYHDLVEDHPDEWLEVCKILASYAPEGSVLAWGDKDRSFRFFFTAGQVAFQIGVYQDQPLSEVSDL